MTRRERMSIHDLELLLNAEIMAVEYHEGMQGIHLAPDEDMLVSVQVVLRGKPARRKQREDPLDFLDDGNYETGSL